MKVLHDNNDNNNHFFYNYCCYYDAEFLKELHDNCVDISMWPRSNSDTDTVTLSGLKTQHFIKTIVTLAEWSEDELEVADVI